MAEYTEALKKARSELRAQESALESANETIKNLDKEIQDAKNRRVRLLGEVDRLSRLVQSLIAAGGVQ